MSIIGRKRKCDPKHPYLSGNFAPVTKIHSSTPCTHTGTIPPELFGGQYVRNGGNPVSNSDLGRDAHWFDGDGMLAGVFFQPSSSNPNEAIPNFVNQYILTDVCMSAFEHPSLRTPILPSIATLVNPLSSLIVTIFCIFRSLFLTLISHMPGSQQAIKRISVANTGILFHDRRALATCESGPPIRIQLPGLETMGWYDGNQAEGELDEVTAEKKEEVLGGTGIVSWMKEWTTGHPKIDPATGEMILFHCNFVAPYVHYSSIPSTSHDARVGLPKLLNAPVPGCSGGKMMHDFGVSSGHTVILDLPLTLTPFNLMKGEPVVSYDDSKPSRFGVFPRRDPSKVQWFETDGCCIFHTANTWDELDSHRSTVAVNMLSCRLTSASLVFSAGNLPPPVRAKPKTTQKSRPMSFFAPYDDDEIADPELPSSEKTPLISPHHPPLPEDADEEQCRLYYHRFSLTSSSPTITHEYALSRIPFEFPTLNPAYEMSAARYIYGCSTSNESFGAALGKATKIDVLVKMDVHTLLHRAELSPPKSVTGCVDTRNISQVLSSPSPHDEIQAFKMPDGWYAQEARFVACQNPTSEDDGYLLFYAFDEGQLDDEGECKLDAVSQLWILDARNMRDVVAKVTLPQRVPYGLHGNWFEEGKIQGQRGVERVRSMPIVIGEGEETVWGKVKRRVIGWVG
ncbi:carotenoid oxygenase [Clohesyomyces aquaticus]|uniref:Carotenoid oxygenase n=1 Tax=Clohesyomyces aquaticus TaxID=1231657 RepID=A0A1Y1Z5D4_9PLEO|nr:carotenoid oxygenase [Clohesyomyces aquaticus]